MKRQIAEAARRARQYPAWWVSEVKRGHREGWAEADRAKAEYLELKARNDLAEARGKYLDALNKAGRDIGPDLEQAGRDIRATLAREQEPRTGKARTR